MNDEFNQREREKRDERLCELGLRGEPPSAFCLRCQNPLPHDRKYEMFCVACD